MGSVPVRFSLVSLLCRAVVVGTLSLAGIGCGDDGAPRTVRTISTWNPTNVPPDTVVPPDSVQGSIISISPSRAPVGSADITVTITGKGFDGEGHLRSYVKWQVPGVQQESFLNSHIVSSTELTAVIPAELLARPATASVYVENYDLMGDAPGAKSRTASFLVQ